MSVKLGSIPKFASRYSPPGYVKTVAASVRLIGNTERCIHIFIVARDPSGLEVPCLKYHSRLQVPHSRFQVRFKCQAIESPANGSVFMGLKWAKNYATGQTGIAATCYLLPVTCYLLPVTYLRLRQVENDKSRRVSLVADILAWIPKPPFPTPYSFALFIRPAPTPC